MEMVENIDVGMLAQMRLDLEAAEMALAALGDEATDEALEEIDQLRQAVEALEAEQRRRLDALATYLGQEFERCIKARANVDRRMWDDIRQYEGKSRLNVPNKRYPTDNNDAAAEDQENTIHATRSFTNLFAARVVDMVLPTNEVPFRVDPDENPDPLCVPTFVPPEAQEQPGPDGQPVMVEPTPEDITAALEDANARAAGAMLNTIRDQLFEAGLQKHGRAMIDDGLRIGLGLVRGPFQQYKRRNKVRFVDGAPEPVVEVETMTVPGLAYVNPSMFWYDMTPGLEKARKTFEVELYDRSELMELKKYPGVILQAVDELLEERQPCVTGALGESLKQRNSALGLIEPLDGRWAVVRVYAAIDPQKLREIGGIEWPHADVMPLIEMLMSNNKCLKWKLGELECGYRVPYYAFTPFPCDDTIYGWSVPYMARSAQHNIDGVWEATKLNAAMAAGTQLFLKKKEFTPKDGAFRVVGPKIWEHTGDGPITDAMASTVITSNVEGNLKLLEVAKDNMSSDTMLSQILQGDATKAQQTAAGYVQEINLATVVQRRIAAQFDDGVAQPMAEAFGQWNSLYNPDPSIKGDFDYKGTASSAMIARDVQTQHLQVLTSMAGDPRFAGFTDDYELWAANVAMLDIPRKDQICRPRDKALAEQQRMQQGQQDPAIAAKMAEIDLQKEKLQKESDIRMAELAIEKEKLATDAAYRLKELGLKRDIANLEYQKALVEANARANIDIARVDAQADAATRENASKNAIEGAKLGQQAAKDSAELELKAAKLAQDGQRVQLAQNPSPDSALD